MHWLQAGHASVWARDDEEHLLVDAGDTDIRFARTRRPAAAAAVSGGGAGGAAHAARNLRVSGGGGDGAGTASMPPPPPVRGATKRSSLLPQYNPDAARVTRDAEAVAVHGIRAFGSGGAAAAGACADGSDDDEI